MNSLMINLMQGLGDNIYARPFVRAALMKKNRDVYVKTCWPQLFWDLVEDHGLKLVKWSSKLRCQGKNEDRFGVDVYSPRPCCAQEVNVNYSRADLREGLGIVGGLRMTNHLDIDDDFSFQPKSEWLAAALPFVDRPYALIKPPTLRTDWHNEARNPCPRAFQRCIDEQRETHFMISLADLTRNKEWLAHPVEGIDLELHDGDLPLETVIGLAAMADVLLTAPGFFIPLGISLHVKTFCVFGGWHRPTDVIDSCMNLDRYAYVAPEPFCACMINNHNCNKDIDHLAMIRKLNKLTNKTRKEEKAIT
jgi:hypothetical protein